MVKVRKEGAFTEQAEKYQMSVKQFARFVEANQLLFSVDTRKKAQVANAFQGFKETTDWDEFFEDTEMVEDLGGMINKTLDKGANLMKNPLARAIKKALVSPVLKVVVVVLQDHLSKFRIESVRTIWNGIPGVG